MGRPRKPTALKLVGGTDRLDRKVASEPQPPVVEIVPPAPEHFSSDEAEFWNTMAELLTDMGVLTAADMPAFELLNSTRSEMLARGFDLAALGGTTYETRSAKDGFMRRAHPEAAQYADAQRRYLHLLAQFGLTPAARTKVSASGSIKADKLSKYFS